MVSARSDPGDFDRNDFDDIYSRYFEDLIAARDIAADPSGWARTEAPRDLAPPAPAIRGSLAHYVVDNRSLIAWAKEPLLALLSRWDRSAYSYDEVTITPSISTAALAVLLRLRASGTTRILFETPAYYATIEQANALGIETRLLATHFDDAYRWEPAAMAAAAGPDCACWLTQPRYALGDNQRPADIVDLLHSLPSGSSVVVDETSDQNWPSVLGPIRVGGDAAPLIKIRGLVKPLGLNGLRLAAIMHPVSDRAAFQELQWLVGGALDAYSLAAGMQLAEVDDLYPSMLAAARSSIARRRRRLAMTARRAPIHLSSMDNGYLGTMELEWANGDGGVAKRGRLLEFCRNEKMPVTLGSAMLFARDRRRERVRLNYFMPMGELEYSVRALRRFLTGS